MSKKPIKLFVAATGQHVGKTTTCLGMLTGLRKFLPDSQVNYIKPVGQQHVVVDGVKVDKDVVLFKKWFDLSAREPAMSPVVVPAGFTRDYIDNKKGKRSDLVAMIDRAVDEVSKESDLIVVEGTGHTGVGSIFELNNAQVASQLKAKVLLVANGGLGSSFDELELNRLAYQNYNVEVIGVVLNKCKPSKIPMLQDYFGRVLKERWNVPLLGIIPQDSFLTQSTLIDLVKHLKAEQVAGEKYGDQHYDTHNVTMVATNLTRFLERLQINFDTNQHGTKSPLILSHVTRNDIILGYLSHWQKCKALGIEWTGALVLASGSDKNARGGKETLQAHVLTTIIAMDVPVLLVKGSNTFQISKSACHSMYSVSMYQHCFIIISSVDSFFCLVFLPCSAKNG